MHLQLASHSVQSFPFECFKKVPVSAVYSHDIFFSVVASERSTTATIIPENLKHILEPMYPYILTV
jgi:hypothetical protein